MLPGSSYSITTKKTTSPISTICQVGNTLEWVCPFIFQHHVTTATLHFEPTWDTFDMEMSSLLLLGLVFERSRAGKHVTPWKFLRGGGCGYDIIYIILERAFSLISYNFCISTSFLSIETTTFVICSCYENLNNSQFHWKANHMGVESSYHYKLTRV